MRGFMIKIGNFFFKHRNQAFPVILVLLYFFGKAPSDSLFDNIDYERAKDAFAIMVTLSGLLVRSIVIGFAYIKRGGLNKKIYADKLVIEGIFAICRNPLYLGNILIYLGIFLMHGGLFVIFAGMALFLFIYQSIIFAEEAYLTNKFGADYVEYCRNVPRWIPRISKFKEATTNMEFDLKRVIYKDYSTIAVSLIALTATEIYEVVASSAGFNISHIAFLSSLIVLFILFTAVVKGLKKRAAAA